MRADGHVALAGVVAGWRLPWVWQPSLDDEVADVLLHRFDTVYGAHPAVAHAAQERRAGGVPAFRRLEPVEDHQLGPGAVEVEVVGVAMHRRDLRARWPGGHLGDGHRAVRPSEPLHVRQRVTHAERLKRGRPPLADPGVVVA